MNRQIKKYLKRLKEMHADEAFLQRAKEELSLHMKRVPAVRFNENIRLNNEERSSYLILNYKTMVPVFLILALVAGGGGTAYASQGSMPGDTLYSVKIATEEVRLAVASMNPEAQADFRLEFAGRRVEEIKKVLAASQEKGLTEKQEDALNKALENFDSQLGKIFEKAKKLKIENRLDRAVELNSELSVASEIYKEVLEVAKENSKDKLKNRISDKLDNSINIAKKSKGDSDDEINEISEDGDENPEGLIKNSKRWIDLADKNIALAEVAINENQSKLSEEVIKKFSEILNKAKTNLVDAKGEFEKGDYNKAVDKSRASSKEASRIVLFIKISPKGFIDKFESRGTENNASSTSNASKIIERIKIERKDLKISKVEDNEDEEELGEIEELEKMEKEIDTLEVEIEETELN